jgi:hypothetical protein
LSKWKRVMPVVMIAIFVRCDADIEAALSNFKSKMLAKFKDMVNRAAVGAEGNSPAAADPGEQRVAKRHRTSGSGAAATANAGKEALTSVGIEKKEEVLSKAKEWSVTEILQAVAYLAREVLGATTRAVISPACSSSSWTLLERRRCCSSIWAHASRRQGLVREAAQQMPAYWRFSSALSLTRKGSSVRRHKCMLQLEATPT